MTHIDRALRTLPAVAQFHALGKLDRLLPLLSPTHEPCACGALNSTDDFLCGACGASTVENLPPLSIWDERPTRRRLEEAFLRAVHADAKTANVLARAWLWALDSEVQS